MVLSPLIFLDDEWSSISDSAKILISNMLKHNPRFRYSAREAYNHAWIQNNTSQVPLDSGVISKLQSFNNKSRFRHAILTFFATRMVTSKESEEMISAFQSLDTNGDGVLSRQELIEGFKKTKPELSEFEIEHIIDDLMGTLDVNGEDSINFTEFVVALLNQEKVLNEERIQQVFSMFDEDNDGYIAWSEFRKIMGPVKNSEFVAQTMIKEFDHNGDGKVNTIS